MTNGQDVLDALLAIVKSELDAEYSMRPLSGKVLEPYGVELQRRLSASTSIPFTLSFVSTPEGVRRGEIKIRAVVAYPA